MAARCNVLLVVVNTDEQLEERIVGDHGVLAAARPGTIVAVHTTARLETLRTLLEPTQRVGVELVDAGVTGGADPARRGEVAVLVGGADDTVARLGPVLAVYSSVIVHIGPFGSGMAAKHAVQTVLMGKVAAAYEGLLLAQEAGVDPTTLARVVQHAEDQSGIHPFYLDAKARAMAHGADDAWRAVSLHQQPIVVKDLDAALALADALAVDLPVTRGARASVPDVWSA